MIGYMCRSWLGRLAVAGYVPEAVFVGLGAIPGAWLRLVLVNRWTPMVPKKHWGTFAVNVVACFALGLLLSLVEQCGPGGKSSLELMVAVGFFGSLSTFSTFAVELLQEIRQQQFLSAFLLAVASIVAGLLAAACGYNLGLTSYA